MLLVQQNVKMPVQVLNWKHSSLAEQPSKVDTGKTSTKNDRLPANLDLKKIKIAFLATNHIYTSKFALPDTTFLFKIKYTVN